jgi:hypothetical protein
MARAVRRRFLRLVGGWTLDGVRVVAIRIVRGSVVTIGRTWPAAATRRTSAFVHAALHVERK